MHGTAWRTGMIGASDSMDSIDATNPARSIRAVFFAGASVATPQHPRGLRQLPATRPTEREGSSSTDARAGFSAFRMRSSPASVRMELYSDRHTGERFRRVVRFGARQLPKRAAKFGHVAAAEAQGRRGAFLAVICKPCTGAALDGWARERCENRRTSCP